LTSPAFLAIMPEFGPPAFQRANISVRNKTMKRNAKKRTLALIAASAFVLTVLAFGSPTQQAQATQSGSSDKPQASASGTPGSTKPGPSSTGSATSSTATPAPAAPAKTQTPPANGAGVVWINTDTGIYHKQGTRWYGKTKHGKYMLEADAVKAGYKPAK
jgi:hypothetical protein